MIRKNINDIQMRRCILLDKLVFFTEDRVDRRDLPDNIYVYELRDGYDTTPIELANSVTVDFYGTVLVNEPCPVDLDKHYVMLRDKDFSIYDEEEQSFMFDDPEPHDYFAAKDVCIWTCIPNEQVHPIDSRKPIIKLFISQPFTGYDDNEIRKQRKLLHELYALYVNRPIEDIILIDQLDVVDEYDIEGHFDTSDDRSFYQLCRSVGMMKNADVVIFYGEWYKSKGACIEHSICQTYHKISVENDELIEFCKNNPKYDDDYFMPLWKKKFFDMHDIADVNIFKDPKGGFKATAELNCNGYTVMGDTPNDAYLNLYDMLEEIIHTKMVNQIDSLGKAKAVKIVVCNDAETIKDSDINKIIRDDKPGDVT